MLASLRNIALLLLLLLPCSSSAITLSTNWTLSTSLDNNPEKAGTTNINLSECKKELANNNTYSFTFKLSSAAIPEIDARYSIKLATSDQACDESSLDAVAGDACTLLVDSKTLPSSATLTEEIAFADLTSITSTDECDGASGTAYLYLIVSETSLGNTTPTVYNISHKVVFNTARPAVPTGLTLTAGESTIDASWDEVSGADSYNVYYSTEAFPLETPPEDQASSVKKVSSSGDTNAKISGLAVDTAYYVAVVAVDEDDNESFFSTQESATTVPVIDFWEAYSQENPSTDSGFCFIATAAYGSYQAPHVQVLRRFRDTFLMTNAPGRLFVKAYYAVSPPFARWIAAHDSARAVVRAALWPLYVLAVVLLYGGVWSLALLSLCFAASLWLARRVWTRRKRTQTAAQAISSVPSAPSVSGDMSGGLSPARIALGGPPPQAGTSSKRSAPVGALLSRFAGDTIRVLALCAAGGSVGYANAQYLPQGESPVSIMLEIKGGAYSPTEMGAAFDTYFPDASPIMIEIEYDWQFYRGIGSAAIGASIGYASVEGSGRTQTGEVSADSTSLAWLPLRLQLVYRFDWVAHNWNIPFVPYGKIGLDYYFWWVTNGEDETATNASGQSGSGGTFGWNGVGGLAFLLDWLAPSMAKTFDMEWGVNNSYLFAEYMYVQADGFGSAGKLDLSSSLFMFGLALEF